MEVPTTEPLYCSNDHRHGDEGEDDGHSDVDGDGDGDGDADGDGDGEGGPSPWPCEVMLAYEIKLSK